MTEKVEVDPELQRVAAAKAAQVTDRIRAVLTALENSSDGKGQPWGDDEYGEKFAKGDGANGYLSSRDNLTTLVDKLAGKSDSHSTTQQDAAKLHDNTDKSNADAFKQ
ncbi:hypothetical protein VMT65_18480 [Nocardia sp. CDC153]|uniref:WXG100 family type VII secretion target n=1 Tax=Nocardia sp. CDC153 TaxID=3112167 RepID=UPI002DBDF1F1|nr:hypothetical protein [Nocardia sp. CDC153]MEC3955034.1 hypothetical protein [Nocardia sp. CDC153]